ncbi:DgyrCDS13667 [Dimorphilus gyrociliatus]|uniref:DgyrCDS13667 n=1 Tax=Dimorphilus gyrociliatus TaxID=2664684 RepID=A0A7I8WBE1_9ANNE|nr:DgyrCDS13667 [Dimorphilus gyrociliatus]
MDEINQEICVKSTSDFNKEQQTSSFYYRCYETTCTGSFLTIISNGCELGLSHFKAMGTVVKLLDYQIINSIETKSFNGTKNVNVLFDNLYSTYLQEKWFIRLDFQNPITIRALFVDVVQTEDEMVFENFYVSVNWIPVSELNSNQDYCVKKYTAPIVDVGYFTYIFNCIPARSGKYLFMGKDTDFLEDNITIANLKIFGKILNDDNHEYESLKENISSILSSGVGYKNGLTDNFYSFQQNHLSLLKNREFTISLKSMLQIDYICLTFFVKKTIIPGIFSIQLSSNTNLTMKILNSVLGQTACKSLKTNSKINTIIIKLINTKAKITEVDLFYSRIRYELFDGSSKDCLRQYDIFATISLANTYNKFGIITKDDKLDLLDILMLAYADQNLYKVSNFNGQTFKNGRQIYWFKCSFTSNRIQIYSLKNNLKDIKLQTLAIF